MRSPVFAFLLAVVAAGALPCTPAVAQINRRDRLDPELVLEPGGRTGACDFLTFTSDGNHLLAAGDDKVVRIWDFARGKLAPGKPAVLRWSIWREQRGSIYALAMSPDDKNKYLAIGGLGALNTTVSVLDRNTGDVINSASPQEENYYAVWSVAFAPSGKRIAFGAGDGSVFVWNFLPGDGQKYQWCGRDKITTKPDGDPTNIVRLVRFLDENTVLSVAEDGTVSKWALGDKKPVRTDLEPVTDRYRSLSRVIVSPDGKWLAAAFKGPAVAVRSLDGKQTRDFALKDGEFPRALAFDPRKENRLAVSVGTLVPGSGFHIEADDAIRFYDLGGPEPKYTKGPPHSYRAEFLAFHPEQNYLAVAGGDSHEVTLWDLGHLSEPADVVRGAGACLWDVALSSDGSRVAFQDHRDPRSTDLNRRGSGPWRVFNLPQRRWDDPNDFEPVKQLTEADGWRVKPHPTDPYKWYAVSPRGKEFLLPRFEKQENMPRCYTFLKAAGNVPTRLAVGHYWGLSLYELTEREVRRTRVFAGHQGEVTALAVSADQSWIVSAANDQTIAAWNLGDTFPSNPILGARFAIERDRLVVKAVDVGSPAWEAGLLKNDEVTLFAFGGTEVEGGPKAWLKRLEDPVPGMEHYFRVRRGGRPLTAAERLRLGMLAGCTADRVQGQTLDLLTTARHRPLWRFFPTRDGEWALWMWRNSFYDCSTRGDSYIGFHVNAPKLSQPPAFYRAEQFRELLNRSDVIDKLLQTRNLDVALREVSDNPMPLAFSRFEPPAVALQLGATGVTDQDKDVVVKLLATAPSDDTDYQPARAELWINDYRLFAWDTLAAWSKDGLRYSLEVRLPTSKLRRGRNVVTFQTYNHAGGRADIASEIECRRPAAKPHGFVLGVGVDDYSNAKVPAGQRDKLQNLRGAGNDAKEFAQALRQQCQVYGAQPVLLEHLGDQAKRAEVLRALDELAQKVGPDDTCVVLFAGHGLFIPEKVGKDDPPRTTFVFCGPDFDLSRPTETGISSEVLYKKLAAIAGRKVVILDACHSGEAAVNPVRGLVPSSQGPVILAACDRHQVSFEFPPSDTGNDKDNPRHGLFTYAILEALGDRFKDADTNHDGELDAAEIYWYTRKRLPALLKQIKQSEDKQVPIMFAPSDTRVPLARIPEK
jgi:WD40 repeat protein/uncharacterized caspase-like protein